MTRPQAHGEIQIDNDQVRVSRFTFPPGSETGQHRHGYDYVVVPVTTGTLTIEGNGETMTADLMPGASYNRSAGVDHNVINNTDHEIVFIEIELLEHAE